MLYVNPSSDKFRLTLGTKSLACSEALNMNLNGTFCLKTKCAHTQYNIFQIPSNPNLSYLIYCNIYN